MPKHSEQRMYDLSEVLAVDGVSSLEPGSIILVSGAGSTDRETLLLDVLADGVENGEGAVGVTTDGQADEVISAVTSRLPDADPHAICAVDCKGESDRAEFQRDDGSYVYRVETPSDMTGIGIGITNCFDRLQVTGIDRGRLTFTDLSTLIDSTDEETVFKFCHVLSSRLDSSNFLGLFALDTSAHEAQTIQVIKQVFDGHVELRERDGQRQARTTGFEDEPSEWTDL